MEAISANNYEIWFTDYLDGQLDDSQLGQLLDFLEEHPDLKAELQGITNVNLSASQEIFQGKDRLMKTGDDIPGIAADDQLCIARMENDLPDDQKIAFDRRLLRDAGLTSLYGKFLKTRLKPEPVIFEHKTELLHKTRTLIPWMITAISSAAIIILGLLLWPRENEPSKELISKTPGASENVIALPEEKTIPSEKPAAPAIQMASVVPDTHQIIGTPETSGAETPNQNPQREFVPMNSLGHKMPDMFQVSIPDPGSNPVIFASAFLRSVESAIPEETYLTIPQYALQLFREKILGEERSFVKRTRFSLWEVAGAGISGINKIAGTDMRLDREYGSNGQVMAVSFNSRLVDFETPVKGLQGKEQ